MAGMTGVYRHTLDAKGRLFIPAKLREELGDTFFVTISTERCLTAYSMESWDRLNEKIRELPRSKQTKMRPLQSASSTPRAEYFCLRRFVTSQRSKRTWLWSARAIPPSFGMRRHGTRSTSSRRRRRTSPRYSRSLTSDGRRKARSRAPLGVHRGT